MTDTSTPQQNTAATTAPGPHRFQKGHPFFGHGRGGRRYGERKKKVSEELRAMILGALKDMGGRKWFVQAAQKNPAAFMILLSKLLPQEITSDSPIVLATLDDTRGLSDAELDAIIERGMKKIRERGEKALEGNVVEMTTTLTHREALAGEYPVEAPIEPHPHLNRPKRITGVVVEVPGHPQLKVEEVA